MTQLRSIIWNSRSIWTQLRMDYIKLHKGAQVPTIHRHVGRPCEDGASDVATQLSGKEDGEEAFFLFSEK